MGYIYSNDFWATSVPKINSPHLLADFEVCTLTFS